MLTISEMTPVPEHNVESNISSTASNLARPRRYYPDGGYGWVIVFCSFLLYLIADGIAYTLGLINTAWLVYFNESETKTSWIGSIFYSTPLLAGPIMSQLIERYGCKKMTVIGGAIGAFGFIISSLCNSVEQLYFTIGIIGGCGFSAAYIVGLLTVERWFETKRNLAIGIVSAGTGFGTFLFAPIMQLLLDSIGWKLTLVSLSGLLMVVSVVGVFLDDPQWKIEEDFAKKAEAIEKKSVNDEAPVEKNLVEKLKNFVNFSHFKDPNFALLGMSTFFIYALYNTAIYFMTELLHGFGYTETQSAWYLSIIGFFLMLGMVALGWSADRKIVDVVILNAACVLGKFYYITDSLDIYI